MSKGIGGSVCLVVKLLSRKAEQVEIGSQLKMHRERLGISQEELASRIYVSRQTISNWETGRTYPDLQSLLLLSEQFGTSTDTLVKGDLAKMEEVVENDWKKMQRLTAAGWALVGVGVVLLAVGFLVPTSQSSIVPAFSEGELLASVAFLLLWAAGMVPLGQVERLKRKNDLVTYRDILAYSRGEEPPRHGADFSRDHPHLAIAAKTAVGMVAGFASAFLVCTVFGALLGA